MHGILISDNYDETNYCIMKTLTFLITLFVAIFINPMFIDDSIEEPITGADSNTEENSESFDHLNSLNDTVNIVFSMSSQYSIKGTESIIQQLDSTEHFKINIPEDGNYEEFEVINQLGQKIYSQKLSNTDKTISVDHNWEAGAYFIRLKSDEVSVTGTLIIK